MQWLAVFVYEAGKKVSQSRKVMIIHQFGICWSTEIGFKNFQYCVRTIWGNIGVVMFLDDR
jgi:hypothetical protein